MFGYIKPDRENLLVKDLALYNALYCSLCRTIKKDISPFVAPGLSYDAVFLALIRAKITGEKINLEKSRCCYNPLKKKTYAVNSESIQFSSRVYLLLLKEKLSDDIHDKDKNVIKRFLENIALLHIKSIIKKIKKKNPEISDIEKILSDRLGSLYELENKKSNSIDETSILFGDALADAFSYGLYKNDKAIMVSVAQNVGRFIYIADAVDDMKKDEKANCYNPILCEFGTYDKAKENIDFIDKAVAELAKNAHLAVNLADTSPFDRIIENIITRGIGAEMYRIMTSESSKK